MSSSGQSRARKAGDREWFAGYARALSTVWRLHHDARMIRHIMISGGVTLMDLELAKVDERDLSIARRAFLDDQGLA